MIINGWYCCPHCNKRLFPVNPDTAAENLPYKCKACKNNFIINIKSQVPKSQEP